MTTGRPSAVVTVTTRQRSFVGPMAIVIGIILMIASGVWIWFDRQSRETVVIAARDIPVGTRIQSDDISMIDVPAGWPTALRGIPSTEQVVGWYAATGIPKGMILRAEIVQADPVRLVVFPNGRTLADQTVAARIPIEQIGVAREGTWINIGFRSSDPTLCDRVAAEQGGMPPIIPRATTDGDGTPIGGIGVGNTDDERPRYACRWVSGIPVMYVDETMAYVAMSPAQHLLWQSLQAANVEFWYESYNADQAILMSLDRRYASEQTIPDLVAPGDETTVVEPAVREHLVPDGGTP